MSSDSGPSSASPSPVGAHGALTPSSGRRAPVAERQPAVVARLDDLAHLPERLDREVAAALGVVPLVARRERRDQRRVVDGDDRRVEHVAGRQRVADLEQADAAEPRRTRHPVDEAGSGVDEVDRLVRRRHDVRPGRVIDELRDDPPDRDVLVVVELRVAAARSRHRTRSTACRRRRCRRSSTRKRTSAGRSRRNTR